MRHLAALFAPLLLAAAPVQGAVHYTLAPELSDGAITALDVTIRFRGDPSGTTVLDWGDGWAGEERLGQWARDLTVEGAGAVTLAPHGGRVIHAAAGASIMVRYRVVSAFSAEPNASDVRQPMPVVRPTWFYGVGEALFATPAGRGDAPATFTWKGPSDIGFASDLDHNRARPGKAAKTVDDITESIVIGGRDLRVTNSIAGGAPLRVATLGSYAFDVPRFDALAASIVATERGFWRTRDRQPFLITMVPFASAPGHISYSGTGRSDAFALWMDAGADMSNLGWLLAHEYFHTWNYRQLGELGEDEALSYWLSEGFTDFYARRLLLRAGLITPAAFASSWNEALASYARSTYRSLPEARAAADHWRNRDAEKLPYQRGAMLAAIWDARLRKAGRGNLDDVLREQRRQRGHRIPSPSLTALFATTAAAYGLDIRADVARYVERGEPLALPSDVFGLCASVHNVTRPVFARGYDSDATSKTGFITGLDPTSPAYAAGLRDGMRFLRRIAGTPGNADVDYVLAIDDGGQQRTITFRPAGTAIETLQQIVLDEARFAADAKECTAALAG